MISLAILTDDDPNWRPKGFAYGAWGSRTGMRFPVAKLLDYAGREQELSASNNPAAQIVLAHLEARATWGKSQDRRDAKVRLVKRLYGRGWSADDAKWGS